MRGVVYMGEDASVSSSSEPEARSSVLIVDDDEDLRLTLLAILDGEGFRARCAANGAEALEILRGDPLPGLILLDLTMPEMNGWDFLTRIDANPRWHQIPVALTSGHRSIQRAFDQHQVAEGSKRLLFPKPLGLSRLLSTVRYFCSEPDRARSEHLADDSDEAWSLREAPTASFRPLRS
jgi:CheY-like chemotaxis protein